MVGAMKDQVIARSDSPRTRRTTAGGVARTALSPIVRRGDRSVMTR